MARRATRAGAVGRVSLKARAPRIRRT